MAEPLPTIAFLVAAYNAEETLDETLGSIRVQTCPDWEAVVVDDGSTDATYAIAMRHSEADPRIRVLRQSNAGAASARNAAAARATAPWLLPLDADDVCEPQLVERMTAFMEEHPGFDLYSFAARRLLSDGRIEPTRFVLGTEGAVSLTLDDMLVRNCLLANTIVGRAFFEGLGGFRPLFNEDYDLWLRAFLAGARHVHDPEPLVLYRVRTGSKTAEVERSAASMVEILADLIASGRLDTGQRALAERMLRYYRAFPARCALETRLRAGDYRCARREYLRTRDAYLSAPKYLLGLPLMLVSPGLFRSLVVERFD